MTLWRATLVLFAALTSGNTFAQVNPPNKPPPPPTVGTRAGEGGVFLYRDPVGNYWWNDWRSVVVTDPVLTHQAEITIVGDGRTVPHFVVILSINCETERTSGSPQSSITTVHFNGPQFHLRLFKMPSDSFATASFPPSPVSAEARALT